MKQFLLFTLCICIASSLFSQVRELDVIDTDNDGDAVIQINSNDPAASDFIQMMLGFNVSNQGWLRTRTNHDLSFWTNNTRRMTVKNDGRVGIGTSSPSTDFEVQGNTNLDGNLSQSGSGNTILESTNGTITITTIAATIEVLPNGDINILSSGNIDVDAVGNLSLSADGDIDIDAGGTLNIEAGNIDVVTGQYDLTSQSSINLTANSNYFLSAQNSSIQSGLNTSIESGNDMINSISKNYNLTIGNDKISTISGKKSTSIIGNYTLTADGINSSAQSHYIESGTNTSIVTGNDLIKSIGGDIMENIAGNTTSTIVGDYILHADYSEQTFDTDFELTSVGITSLKGNLIQLNAMSGAAGAARIGDSVTTTNVATGSATVLIGN